MTELLSPSIGAPASGAGRVVSCVYCRQPIAADTFVYWSSARRLMSAACPSCLRRVTLPAVTWRRWSRETGAAATA
jgi:hypothetical protein